MTPNGKPAEVSLPADGQVAVERSFDAPRVLVYRAYTEPELMRKWLVAMPGWTMPVCEMDVRPGGRYRWRWRSDDQEFGFHGEFLEVDAPALLKHTQTYDPGDFGDSMGDQPAIITVRFREQNGGTTVTTLIDYGSNESRDAAMSTGMTDGMEMSYRLLAEILASDP